MPQRIGGAFRGIGAQLGVLLAGAIGWGIGKAIDGALGISDKFAKIWAGDVPRGIDVATKAMRAYRNELEEAKKQTEFLKKSQEKEAEILSVGENAQSRLDREIAKMSEMQALELEAGISREEYEKRHLSMLDQAKAAQEAALAVDKERADLFQQIDQQEQDAIDKQAAREQERADNALKFNTSKMSDRFAPIKEAAALEIKTINEVADAQKAKDDERRDRLQQIMKDAAFAPALLDDALGGSGGWSDAKSGDRKNKQDFDRGVRQAEQAQDRINRGVGTERDFAIAGAMNANKLAKGAREELAQLDKDAKKAAIDTAKSIKIIEGRLAAAVAP
jgi:hypothetical protein